MGRLDTESVADADLSAIASPPQRTKPWADDEYLRIGGRRLVYSADPECGIYVVHLPGRVNMAPAKLRAAGHTIEMPLRLRYVDEDAA